MSPADKLKDAAPATTIPRIHMWKCIHTVEVDFFFPYLSLLANMASFLLISLQVSAGEGGKRLMSQRFTVT